QASLRQYMRSRPNIESACTRSIVTPLWRARAASMLLPWCRAQATALLVLRPTVAAASVTTSTFAAISSEPSEEGEFRLALSRRLRSSSSATMQGLRSRETVVTKTPVRTSVMTELRRYPLRVQQSKLDGWWFIFVDEEPGLGVLGSDYEDLLERVKVGARKLFLERGEAVSNIEIIRSDKPALQVFPLNVPTVQTIAINRVAPAIASAR